MKKINLKQLFYTFSLVFTLNYPVFANNEYKVNIPPNEGIKNQVLKDVELAENNCPLELNNNVNLEILALQLKFTAINKLNLASISNNKIKPIQKDLVEKLHDKILAYSFETKIENFEALHEITLGLLNISFNEFQKNFNPSKDWGRFLYQYEGGEVITDVYNENHKETLQRERMVLGSPWYALGVPLLDMSKYEVIEYNLDQVKINWKVTFSENKSVFLDIGYVKFQKYRDKTLVIFNSVHNIDQGWFGNSLPNFIKKPIALKTLSDMFKGHIDSYIKIIEK